MTAGPQLSSVPPSAPDFEQLVIGQVLLSPDCLSEVVGILAPEQFYVQEHKLIWSAIMSLYDEGAPIHLVSVIHRLKTSGKLEEARGAFYVTQLTNRVSSTASVEYHARIILQQHILREIARVGGEAVGAGMDDSNDPIEELDKLQSKLSKLQDAISQSRKGDIADTVHRVISDFDRKGVDAIATGITALDNIMAGGWRPGEMITLAGRPGMGKTALALSILECMGVAANIGVAMLCCEMSETALVSRAMAQGTGVSAELIRTKNLSDNDLVRLQSYGSKLAKSPVHMIETAGWSVTQVRAACERLVRKGVKVVFVDHIGLIAPPAFRKNDSRENEVGAVSRMLKQTAARLGITVVALCQLSRAVENRADHRPKMSDLRDTGSIEQDSDAVIFIYRPAYYGDDDGGNGMTELIVAKQREGPLGTVHCYFDQYTTAFRSNEAAAGFNNPSTPF